MSNNVLQHKINEKVAQLRGSNNSVVVLKGIPMGVVAPECVGDISFEEIAANKLGYFMKIYGHRQFLTYEEYLLLYDFIVAQYETVYILQNNIYMNQYPLDIYCSEQTRNGLITHFMEVEDDSSDDCEEGNIGELIALYIGLREFNGYILGAYCEKAVLNEKVVQINLFTETTAALQPIDAANDFCDIIEESDYIALVKRLFLSPDEIRVRTSNYTGDKQKLANHLSILAENWSEWTDIYIVRPPETTDAYEHRDEYTQILKQYWGYDSFRSIPVYDMAQLEDGRKATKQISQESIVSNLVCQVERCSGALGDFCDMFVTAPTGAGKSVMFQIPAIYLAQKYNLLTIVISPLIGLMNDQVGNLEVRNYKNAKTINSDISPIIKQDIIEKVADSQYHILYISPETLLSRSDVEQLIGDRTIGMIVIDEAHIVTTWGKQFRPDYWYLGEHIRKLRKAQLEKKGRAFVVATFTATAIYGGIEDMYKETVNSLHMINPITYLGYVKRSDIDIAIKKKKVEKGRSEYELDKLEQIRQLIHRAILTNKKTLIYFPTVALIGRCYEYLHAQRETDRVAIYHGQLDKDKKAESYQQFMTKEKLVMLATKAFGMGIDINDIEIVAHFAPTGNVCDYVQEIGRAARKQELRGEAWYVYDSRDFRHINKLHGMSAIRRYHLIEVIKKIDELYTSSLNQGGRWNYTRKRNAMLLDAENFSYIFSSPLGDEDSNIAKVKSALLTIQKDFESTLGFSPITVRPIPMFAIGFFQIDVRTQKRIGSKYPNCLEEINAEKHICRIWLDKIWNKDYTQLSFPKFKYMLYSKDPELALNREYDITSALAVTIDFADDYTSTFDHVWSVLRRFINSKVIADTYTEISEIADVLVAECGMSSYKARAVCEVVIASMDSYRKKFSRDLQMIYQERTTNSGNSSYRFDNAVNSYFNWVRKIYDLIVQKTKDGELYLVNDAGNHTNEIGVTLGVLEALDVLSFKMIGGANSQLYIYINQVRSLKNILNNPGGYKNKLLEAVSERHLISVKMLTYIYESGFPSADIWDILEDYFLGKIPERVKQACLKENPEIRF